MSQGLRVPPVPSSAAARRGSQVCTDSPLEGDGFEPSVPVAREPVYIAEGELRADRRAAKKIWRGTDGSNPSPSRRESRANLGIKTGGAKAATAAPRAAPCARSRPSAQVSDQQPGPDQDQIGRVWSVRAETRGQTRQEPPGNLRRCRLFGQPPGKNKLRAGSRLLVSRFPEIKFIACCCGVL